MILGVLIITCCSKDVENKVNWDILQLQSNQSLTSEEFLALQVKANGATMPFEEALKLYRDILPLTKGEQVNDRHHEKTLFISIKSKISTKSSGTEEEKIPVYVIKIGNIHTLLSGDRRVKGVLAEIENYNDKAFDDAGINFFYKGLQIYMEKEINKFNNHYDSLRLSASNKLSALTKSENLDDSPMWLTTSSNVLRDEEMPNVIRVTWGQREPHNKTLKKVIDNNGYLVSPPTGCTNVALAQIMSYYKYPTVYEYEDTTYIFDWNGMTDKLLAENLSEPYQTQVADLMKLLGKRCKTKYYYNRGRTYIDNIQPALKKLNYSSQRESYSFYSVRSSLMDNKLVYMRGAYYDKNNDRHTHGFVLCGYKSKQIQYIDRVYRYVGGESGNPNELNSRDWELFSEDISITESNSVYINWGGYGYNDGFFLSNSYDIPDNEYNLQVLTFTNIAPLQ